jgi:hypothetical protein
MLRGFRFLGVRKSLFLREKRILLSNVLSATVHTCTSSGYTRDAISWRNQLGVSYLTYVRDEVAAEEWLVTTVVRCLMQFQLQSVKMPRNLKVKTIHKNQQPNWMSRIYAFALSLSCFQPYFCPPPLLQVKFHFFALKNAPYLYQSSETR